MSTADRTNNDNMVLELTTAMDMVSFPDHIETIDMSDLPSASPARPALTMLTAPQPTDYRPYDELGTPHNPIDFEAPKFDRGRRDEVLCYFPDTGTEQVVKNVLFQDYSIEYSDPDAKVTQAYWPVPHKSPIQTIMGHVEICFVLERCKTSKDDLSDYGDDESDEEEDIVFQLTNQRVAVKVNYSKKMESLRNRHAEDPLKEIAAMQIIGDAHPNVLGCITVLYDVKLAQLNVVMKFCQNGDLFELLQSSTTTTAMPEARARYWFRQFMQGVQYLHSVGICHRDLSPENVMIDQNDCLIIDMGMCIRMPYLDATGKVVQSKQQGGKQRCLLLPQGACGKLPYMCPEIFRNKSPFDGQAADLFTAGTILFCMVTGNRSYTQPHASDPQFYWMTHGVEQLLSDWSIILSPEGTHLLKNLLQINPRLRLTLDEVVNHPWFAMPDDPPPQLTGRPIRRTLAASI
jgi:serine/threonine protein kinase